MIDCPCGKVCGSPALDIYSREFSDLPCYLKDSIVLRDGFSQITVFPLDIIYSITIEAEHIDDCIFFIYRQNISMKLNKKLIQPGLWSFYFSNPNGFPLLFILKRNDCIPYLQMYNAKNITKIKFHGGDFTKRGQVSEFFESIPFLELEESIKLVNFSFTEGT